MKAGEHSITTTGSVNAIWSLWEQADCWNTWDLGLENSSLQGLLDEGVQGKLKPKGGPEVAFKIENFIKHKTFDVRARLPLWNSLVLKHTLTDNGSERKIIHSVEIEGPLSYLFYLVMGKNVVNTLPSALQNLKLTVENNNT